MKENFWDRTNRLAGLRRFAAAITLLNIAGHFFLGFEQSWAHPLVALASAYTMEILLDFIDARLNKRPARFKGGLRERVDFLLSAHISGLACGMLLYANEQLWPVAFAAATAIASKAIIRMQIGSGERHLMNPSNFGLAVTLLLFPWVGVAQPYQFTEGLTGIGDWILPIVMICLGTFLNARFTKRIPLIVAWLSVYLLQGVARYLILDYPVIPIWTSMTGVAFLLFTFYMITDPATTPSSFWGQIAFGGGVAAVYGILVMVHVVFGLFFALAIVSVCRGIGILAINYARKPAREKAPEPVLVQGQGKVQDKKSVLLVPEEA